MATVNVSTQMATSTQGLSRKARKVVMENMYGRMVIYMTAIGKTISKTVMASLLVAMDSVTKETSKMVDSMAMESISKLEVSIMDRFLKDKEMDKVSTYGRTAISTLGNGSMMNSTASVSLQASTVSAMRANMSMVRDMVKVSLRGKMETIMRGLGCKAKNMVLACGIAATIKRPANVFLRMISP